MANTTGKVRNKKKRNLKQINKRFKILLRKIIKELNNIYKFKIKTKT